MKKYVTIIIILILQSLVFGGEFFSASAFRNISEIETDKFVKEFLKNSDIKYTENNANENNPENYVYEISIYKPINGWTKVYWPEYFCAYDFALSEMFNEKLKKEISTIHIYDGDYWAHLMLKENGEIIDKYCTEPNYFEKTVKRSEWKGNAKKLSKHLGIKEDKIKRFYWEYDNIFSKLNIIKSSIYEDTWSCLELWKEIGIENGEAKERPYKTYTVEKKYMDKLDKIIGIDKYGL